MKRMLWDRELLPTGRKSSLKNGGRTMHSVCDGAERVISF